MAQCKSWPICTPLNPPWLSGGYSLSPEPMDSFQFWPPQKNSPTIFGTSPTHQTPRTSGHALGLAGVFTMATWHHQRKFRGKCPTRGTQEMMIFFRWNKQGCPDDLFSFKGVGRIDSSFTQKKGLFGKSLFQLNPGEKKKENTSLLFLPWSWKWKMALFER